MSDRTCEGGDACTHDGGVRLYVAQPVDDTEPELLAWWCFPCADVAGNSDYHISEVHTLPGDLYGHGFWRHVGGEYDGDWCAAPLLADEYLDMDMSAATDVPSWDMDARELRALLDLLNAVAPMEATNG